MARLPIPGQDDGTWGAILNNYLAQAHGNDGALKDGSVKAPTLNTINAPSTNQVLGYNGTDLNWTAASAPLVTSVAGRTGAVTLTKADVGLANVDNTAVESRVATLETTLSGVLPVSLMPAGTTVTVLKSGGTWPARPTARADIIVRWRGADPSPPIVSSGTGGMLDNVDERQIPAV